MITISLDVTLIDKSRIKEIKRKNGKIAKFVDLVLIESPNSDYGDYMVKQQVTKAERESGVQMPILGNARNFSGQRSAAATKPAGDAPIESLSVPF